MIKISELDSHITTYGSIGRGGNIGTYNDLGKKINKSAKEYHIWKAKAYTSKGKLITDPKEIEKHFNPYEDPIEIEPFYREHGCIWKFFDNWARPIKNWYLEIKLKRFERKIDEIYARQDRIRNTKRTRVGML